MTLDDHFENFWSLYPNRKGKKAALKAFEKACKGEDVAEFTKMVCLAVEAQQRYRNDAKSEGEFIPNWKMPATWLNAGCWDDEIKSHAELKLSQPPTICQKPDCNEFVHVSGLCAYHYCQEVPFNANSVTFQDVREAALRMSKGETREDYIERCKHHCRGYIK